MSEPQPLRDFISKVASEWDDIPIRAQKDGKWGSYYLYQLPDSTVAEWLIESMRVYRAQERRF